MVELIKIGLFNFFLASFNRFAVLVEKHNNRKIHWTTHSYNL